MWYTQPFESEHYNTTILSGPWHAHVSNKAIFGSYNGLLPFGCQTFVWTNANLLKTGHLGTKFQWYLNQYAELLIDEYWFENVNYNMVAILSGPQCTKFQWYLNQYAELLIDEYWFENVNYNMVAILSRPQCSDLAEVSLCYPINPASQVSRILGTVEL